MRKSQSRVGLVTVTVGLLLALSAQAAEPKIVILATGGTIAGSAESQTQAGYDSGSITADVSPDLIDAAVAAGAKGVVTAGVGNGNMNAGALAAVGRAVEQGVAVVRATRLMGGAVGRNVEVDDDELGTVVAGELSPAKARVLLKLVLLNTRDPARVQAYFDRY